MALLWEAVAKRATELWKVHDTNRDDISCLCVKVGLGLGDISWLCVKVGLGLGDISWLCVKVGEIPGI